MPTAAPSSILQHLKSAKRLPSPPGTALRVLELCRREDVSVREIAETVMSDPALASRLLRYANSPIVGVGRQVTSIRDAVVLMGLRSVKLTALGFSIASPAFKPRCPGFSAQQFWGESFATATIARHVASECESTDCEEAFTAGLLVNIGRLAIAYGLPEEYSRVLATASHGQRLRTAERETLGLDHMQFGAMLLADWDLPRQLVDVLTYQASIIDSQPTDAADCELGEVVCVATQLAPLFAVPDKLSPGELATARQVIEDALGLDERSWQSVAEEIRADTARVAKLFDVRIDNPASVFDLYAEAQEEATRVGMAAECEQERVTRENRILLRRATTDALTGIANRAKFDERIAEAVAGHRRGHGDFALLMLDIDYFKRFNDTYGHEVGDVVLKEVAGAMRDVLRDVDLVARYGGEEFAILAPQTDEHGACRVAERVRRCVDDLRVCRDGHELHVTISIGVALTSEYPDIPTVEQIVADADKQLYVSKEAGRNRWSYGGRSGGGDAAQTSN